jgi:hypothetical protein
MRNPIFVADCHPSCPTNNFGQPIIYEGAQVSRSVLAVTCVVSSKALSRAHGCKS